MYKSVLFVAAMLSACSAKPSGDVVAKKSNANFYTTAKIGDPVLVDDINSRQAQLLQDAGMVVCAKSNQQICSRRLVLAQ